MRYEPDQQAEQGVDRILQRKTADDLGEPSPHDAGADSDPPAPVAGIRLTPCLRPKEVHRAAEVGAVLRLAEPPLLRRRLASLRTCRTPTEALPVADARIRHECALAVRTNPLLAPGPFFHGGQLTSRTFRADNSMRHQQSNTVTGSHSASGRIRRHTCSFWLSRSTSDRSPFRVTK
jgi:hypothetical protein